MLELVSYFLLGTIVLLTVFLAVRVNSLYQVYSSQEACFSQAMKFSHKQLGKLESELSAPRESICLYLIGAIEFLGKQHNYSTQDRRVLTIKVLKSFFEISAKELSEYYVLAAKNKPNTTRHNLIRSGAKAAKLWLKEQKTLPELDLNNQLDDLKLAAAA